MLVKLRILSPILGMKQKVFETTTQSILGLFHPLILIFDPNGIVQENIQGRIAYKSPTQENSELPSHFILKSSLKTPFRVPAMAVVVRFQSPNPLDFPKNHARPQGGQLFPKEPQKERCRNYGFHHLVEMGFITINHAIIFFP